MYTVIAHSAQAVSTSGHSDEDLVSDNELKENVRVVAALKDMLLAPEEPGEVKACCAHPSIDCGLLMSRACSVHS